ncbi:hypothetical protein HSB1_45580 [Halogranum salarium B-1]|uniref:DUF7827 domain-containing protein n=2 Tax=Halogranum rubrum TaxID=553466 RepID=J3ET26_9EURY|nr:hypothetical protein HSB1_45580 [Halogranum salarium B-1]
MLYLTELPLVLRPGGAPVPEQSVSPMPPSSLSTTLVRLAVVAVLVFATVAATPGVLAADATVTFDAETYSATRGAIVPLTISLDGAQSATVTLTETTGAYAATVTVVDADEDGTVRLELDTFAAGSGNDFHAYRATDGDQLVSVTRLTPARSDPLPAGTYALVAVAGESQDDATLTLSPFSLGAVTVETAPHVYSPFGETPTVSDTVASGDWVILRFDAPGLSGVVDTDRPPVSALVYADPSTPRARSTHTVRAPVADALHGVPLRSLVVDYEGETDARPWQLTPGADAAIVGVDHDSDGTLDIDLTETLVSVSTYSDGRYRLQFDGAYALAPGDELVVQYELYNPDTTGSDPVAVRINDETELVGVATYGPAGQGTLGNGVTLDLVRVVDDEAVPVSLANAHYRVDLETEELVVATIAPELAEDETSAEYVATLALSSDSVYADDIDDSVVARYTVVPRTASIDGVSDGTLSVDQHQQRLSGTTTVAPGSRLVVYAVRYDDPRSFIQARLVTVSADGSWEADFEFTHIEPGSRFDVAVYDLEHGGITASAELTPTAVPAVVTSAT